MDKNIIFGPNIIDMYNSAYDAYLSKIDPVIIFHTFITELIKTIGATCGAVMKYDCDTMITEIITHASSKQIDMSSNINSSLSSSQLCPSLQLCPSPSWLIFSNYVRNNKILNNTSIIMQCLTSGTTRLENNCSITNVLGIDDPDNDSFKLKKDAIMFIPCCVAGFSNGLIIVCFDKELTDNENDLSTNALINTMRHVGDMIGVLMNNIKYRPRHCHCADNDHIHSTSLSSLSSFTSFSSFSSLSPSKEIKKKNTNCKTSIDGSVTFQLIHDTLNTVTDTVAVTDADMRIVYKNDNFLNMIKTRYQIDCVPDYLIDVIPQTITLMGSRDDIDDKYVSGFYRNKKMNINDNINKLNESESMIEIIVNSTISCNDIYHIFRFCDKNALINPLESVGRSKNLIAYLSHELRNPIQAISTGVYLVDRSIKSMIKKMESIEETCNTSHSEILCKSLMNSQTFSKNGIRIDKCELNKSSEVIKDRTLSEVTEVTELSDSFIEYKTQLKRSDSSDKDNKPSKFLRRSYIKTNDENNDVNETTINNMNDFEESEGDLSIECCNYDNAYQLESNLETNLDTNLKDSLERNLLLHSSDKIESTTSDYMNDSSVSYGSDSDIFSPWRSNCSHNGSPNSFNPTGIDGFDTMRCVIKRVSSACKNMNIIIDDILDLSKIDSNELIINFDEHSLREITEMIVEESKIEVNKKGLQFIYDFDETSPEIIYTDGTRLFQILSNLISNAIKYSNTGVIKFKVSYNNKDNTIIFQVIDQGRGIRNEEISNLFKQFGRTSNSVTDINSTGLGLCVCHKIATLLGGAIDVTSTFRKGSTFTFTHPIKLGYSGNQSKIEQYDNREIKGDILIVDDDPNITALFKLLLRCMNYDKGYELNIETANTGEKAIQLADIKHYDLIFMDIDLDGEDGCTICNRILNESKLNRSTNIVAVTANIKSVQNDRDSRFNLFSNVILKPFNNKNINDTIIKYLCK